MATKEENGIKEMLLRLTQFLWNIFHSHFCLASRKKVVRAGQEMMWTASVDCVQVLDHRLRLYPKLSDKKSHLKPLEYLSFFLLFLDET